jgi:glycosyltransferase involved in cell wall biosynthesis
LIKVLVNASTLVVGGGIQIGVSFVEVASKRSDFEFAFLVSDGIFASLPENLKKDKRVIVCSPSPAALVSGRKSREFIKNKEREFDPAIVYSIGFPSYIRFKSLEIGRYTNPWEINLGPLPWHTVQPFQKKIKTLLGIYYRQLWAKRTDHIETQTEAAKNGIHKRIGFSLEKIKVIPNSPNPVFFEVGNSFIIEDLFKKRKEEIFCLSAGYRHKNLNIIPRVARHLKSEFKYCPLFVLTLPLDSIVWKEIEQEAEKLEVKEMIKNVGPLKVRDCLSYYQDAKIVFLPTLLEVFSATYLEAMAMKVPIVTTDLDFALDNCKSGAVFYKHNRAVDAAQKIFNIMNNEGLYCRMIKEGLKALGTYPSPEEKFEILFTWFKQLANNKV